MNKMLKQVAIGLLGERRCRIIVALKDRGMVATLKYGFKNMIDEPTLQEIGEYHRTDKYDEKHAFAGLSYLNIYERYFHQFKNKRISVLEIGVKHGASLRTWKSYFKNAQIYGIDIDPRCKSFAEERTQIEIGSQDDIEFLNSCFGKDTKFDVIIDDGSHINKMTIVSFENLFSKRMNAGGIYVIEDLGCSYNKSMGNDRKDMDKFFLEKIENLDKHKSEILSLHFWCMTCVITKA